MKNENVYIMKQPALGKKISDLRKQKGLTQEELVEKCNINVRTIQRIEAGEVTPRSYTIKTILEALEAKFDTIFDEDDFEQTPFKVLGTTISHATAKRSLAIAWIFGIIYFFMAFVVFAFEFKVLVEDDFFEITTAYTIVKIITTISFVLFIQGFIIVGAKYKNNLLQIIALLTLLFMIFATVYDVTAEPFTKTDEYILLVKAVTSGILQIIFGAAILQLRTVLKGALVSVMGVFEIVVGILFVTVIGAILGEMLLVPLEIMEIAFLFMMYKKMNNRLAN